MSTELTQPETHSVHDQSAAGPADSQSAIPEAGCPLSFAQERLWFLHQIEPDSPAYNVPLGMRIRGAIDVGAMRRSLETIVQRHEILRTRYRSDQGAVFQIVCDDTQVPLRVIDLTGEPFALRESALQQIMASAVRRPFDLCCDLMLRAHLWRLREDEHVLLLVFHHIAADEWSLNILLRELEVCYTAFASCQEPLLDELPIQYADYAIWQREWLQGERLEKLQRYWQARISRSLSALELPMGSKVCNENACTAARESLKLSSELSVALKELCRRQDVTLFTGLLASFKTLLYRYVRRERIVIGSPMAGRTRVELEPLIGFFVNTLVLQTDLSGDLTFVELLDRVRETTLGAFAHQELPFEKLVEFIRPDRAPGRVPIVDAMFAVEEMGAQKCELPGLAVDLFNVDVGAAKFDLTVVFKHDNPDLTLMVEYRTGRFSSDTVRRLIRHWSVLLQAISTNPHQRIAHLPLLAESETTKILCEWNSTKTDYPRTATIAELFERQAARGPDAVAVIYDAAVCNLPREEVESARPVADPARTRRLTYRELNSFANRLAHRLRALGVGPQVRVGLCVERSPEMIVGMLAILKAGGAYVPLDPSYPKERLAYMVQDSSASVILAQRKFLTAVPSSHARVILIDELGNGDGRVGFQPAGEPGILPGGLMSRVHPNVIGSGGLTGRQDAALTGRLEACPTEATADDLAYVIYTSGSTGHPKGVAVPNRAVVRLACNTDYVQLGSFDRVAQVSNANFDAVTFEIWGPLLNGGCVVGLRQEIALSPKDFAEQLAANGVTTLFLTTALFNQIAREAPEAFGKLRHLLFGGEAVDPKWVRQVLKSSPPARLLHVYGPTESTTFATWFEIDEVQPDATTIPIGRPIANTRVYLLDESMQLAPVGIPGELYIGGDGLAAGYLNQPELTAERFVPDPFSSSPGARLYRTGDVARYREDGAIEFISRRDYQVKVRGYRIELGEIESVLLTHPAISEAVVVALPDPSSGTLRLVAYPVFKHEPSSEDLDQLREFLNQKLPEYMIPSAVVPVTVLPLNANGKVDRAQLPAPDPERSFHRPAYQAPRSEAEKGLVRIWESVLGLKPVGINDNFFELGGHSLLAVRLFAQIEKEFGARLPLATLFQSPTVEKLANLISNKRPLQSSSLLVGIQPIGTRRPMFWIHSLGGDGGGGFFYYRKLAELLGTDQPSFGIRSPEEPFVRIEEMAGHYLEQLIAFQPRGPYFLGGFCFGGNVAFEMARQLSASGRDVGLLVLLESAVPNSPSGQSLWNLKAMRSLIRHFQSWLSEFVHQSPEQIVERVRRKSKSFGNRLSRALSGQTDANSVQLADVLDMSEYPADYVRYATAHWQALMNYVPKPYPGRVTLFRARKQPLSQLDPTLGWGRLASGGVAVNVVPGSHEKMLEEPNVHILAAELKACLVEAQVE